jgi:hypothetical protein
MLGAHEKKPRKAGFFCDPSGFHRMNAITWKQMRQQLEPMRQQLEQQEPMRQQLERLQLALQQELQLLLFCRRRTKQLQR